MRKSELLFKILNFQAKTFFGRFRGIKVLGNPLKSKCASIGDFKCADNSHIIIGSINAASNFHVSAVDGATIELGDEVFLNRNCTIVAREKIKIGNRCSFGPNVCIYDHDHAFGRSKQNGEKFKTSEVVIKDGCWIGANTVILRGSEIGRNCVIGAGCVIRGKIPDNSLVVADRGFAIRQIEM